MGQYSRVSGTVRMVAVPSFHLTLDKPLVEVHKGDLNMDAHFAVGVVRDPGFTKPVYLLVAGTSLGVCTPNPVPPGVMGADLVFDMASMEPNTLPYDLNFEVGGYEDDPEVGM